MTQGPIFIVGTGRSGTTLTLRLLSAHPDLAWISSLTHRFPRWPMLAAYSRILDVPFADSLLPLHSKLRPRPRESYPVLDRVTQTAFTQDRLLARDDVSDEAARRFRTLVEAHQRWQGKSRFLHKHTGFPRFEYLSTIFPNAVFIHVSRDGRAVANSMKNVNWWDGTMKSWWWGPMKDEYRDELRASDDAPIVLAAIVWKTLMEHITRASAALPPERFMEIRYDALVRDPKAVLGDVVVRCNLTPSDRFMQRVERYRVSSRDAKWRSDLSAQEQRLLESSLEGHLERYGFVN